MVPDQGSAYTGTKASYVALSAVTVLALALLCSIWTTDVSGSIALLGLFAVYMASQELLVLFMVFIPASVLVDFMRGLGGPPNTSGRGWLLFLQLLELIAKVAGGFFAFNLWKSVSAGEQRQGGYAAPSAASMPVPGTSAYQPSPYQRVQDPFAGTPAYTPPSSQLTPGGGSGSHMHVSHQQQPPAQQQQQQPQPQGLAVGSVGSGPAPPPPPPAAPHHDLV